jgi:N-sulfoglucosamine sulfohydrolase
VDEYRLAVREFLGQAKEQGRPFFLMANAHDPHRPFAGADQERWRPRPEVRKTYKSGEVPVPEFLPDLPAVRRELAEYFTSVHRADEVVGAVLEELEQAGLVENTLVMFMSDHGMPLPFAKTNCYHQSTRTPWIVRWPGVVEAGSEDREHFVSGIDVTPTFLEAAGLAPLAEVDGSSIVPLLKGEPVTGRGQVFTMINRTAGKREYPMRAVQEGRFLYIWNGWADGETTFRNESQSGRTFKAMQAAAEQDPAIAERVREFVYRQTEELYDVEADPSCLNNLLANQGGKAESRRSAMTKTLWHWMKRTGDPQRGLFEKQVELALD